MAEQFSYTEAITELEKILNELQSDNCNIDTMVEKTKRASELIVKCRRRLKTTEDELRAALDQLRPSE